MDIDKTKRIEWSTISWRKEVITAGLWGSRPREGAKCVVEIEKICVVNVTLEQVQQLDISLYLSSDFNKTLVIGEADTDFDRCFNRVMRTMQKGEVSSFIFSFLLSDSNDIENSKEGTITCIVLLKEFFNEPHIFEWSDSKKYKLALEHKIRGVELFKCGRTRDAFMRFSKALKLLITIMPLDLEYECTYPREEVLSLRVILCNNIASCHLKYKNYDSVITMCNKALDLEPNNVKALFRRAVSKIELQSYEHAQDDLNRILQLEPGNVAAKEKLQEVKLKQKKYDFKMADAMKKMFL
ncbi:hypothetical protein C0J52_17974 [Blattella germanica]|nr:hypothetical protein C0J52_17974 [Blattella germanica]